VADRIARSAFAAGGDPGRLAGVIADHLAGPELRVAFVFADRRVEPSVFPAIEAAIAAPVVGCTASGVIGPGAAHDGPPAVVALGLAGGWLRVGVGLAAELARGALVRGRYAVQQAADALGLAVDALDPARHAALTLVDGCGEQEEAFCIGSAATAPQIRFSGGAASADPAGHHAAQVWANGELRAGAGIVIVLDSDYPFHAVRSSHLLATELRTVVTATRGRAIDQLDGHPAAPRLRELLATIGHQLDEPRPVHAFARYVDGVACVRTLHGVDGDRLILATAVEAGHVLRVMRPGNLLETTRTSLATAAERVGGTMAALLAFSGVGRHAEAALQGHASELAAAYAAYPTIGFHTRSEQTGMLLVNHTLTGLAIGAP
jgi:hypothetical protein